jgi:capsular exopolysaccharide synthesis family protein
MGTKTEDSLLLATRALHTRRESSSIFSAAMAKHARIEDRERAPFNRGEAESASETLSDEPPPQSLTVADQPGVEPSVAHYDELKANFLGRCPDRSTRTILFTGTTHGDGATTTATNFAKALARDPLLKVLLIDANLRNPSLHDTFTIDHNTSLTKLLERVVTGGVPIHFKQGEVQVLPSGERCLDPISLFESQGFTGFLKEMQQTFDFIVLDGPPIFRSAECSLLASKVDATLLVIEAGKTKKQIALRAIQKVEDAGGKVLGVVMNRRRYYIPNWLYRRL